MRRLRAAIALGEGEQVVLLTPSMSFHDRAKYSEVKDFLDMVAKRAGGKVTAIMDQGGFLQNLAKPPRFPLPSDLRAEYERVGGQ